MGYPPKPDFSSVKPTVRKRTALAHESAQHARRSRQFAAAASLLHTDNPGLLQPETNLERTFQVRQSQIHSAADYATRAKAAFHLDLHDSGLAPYLAAVYSRSSRSMLVFSRKGHVANMNWRQSTLFAELYLNETVRRGTFLHSDAFFALAQRKHAFIYDASGAQVHVLRNHREPGVMQFLPHHLLLMTASATEANHRKICYTDTSTGDTVAEHDFAARALKLRQVTDSGLNLSNGVVAMSHANGVVTMWSPMMGRPLAQMFTHPGGVRNVAVSKDGMSLFTAGADCALKVWDLRTYKLRTEWKVPAQTSALTVSQRGLIALSFGAHVQVWAPSRKGDRFVTARNGWRVKPYMTQVYSGKRVCGLDFCPFEDMLAVCHQEGMDTMVVPGAGEATFDSRAPNPYETQKQRRESEVRTLLDKLPKESIALDVSFVGGIEKDPAARLKEIRDRAREANEKKLKKNADKKRAKGRNKISKRLRRKQTNIIDAKKVAMQEKLEQERKTREAAKRIKDKEKQRALEGTGEGGIGPIAMPQALNRFFSKK
eukprot:GFKZ01001603.1.p1 GENE.GFKZ01001603.1~~GFKZ01001603.1.p1  ORF type:complete len:566 (-),score=81.58 GFKZ01001603.1:1384-3012(-)